MSVKHLPLLTILILCLLKASVVFAQDGSGLGESQKQDPPAMPCPGEAEWAEESVGLYLALEFHSSEREILGIDHLEPEDAEFVTDQDVCGQIFHELSTNPMVKDVPDSYEPHFVKAQNFYFVYYRYTHPEGFRIRSEITPMTLFQTPDFNVIWSRGSSFDD